MNDPRHPLTPNVQETICAYIRAGGFPQVAAEAAGIPAKVFDTWMRYGNAKRPQPLYRDFREAVLQAQAIARLCAETKAMERAPLSWLRFGPGRETKRVPGWTDGVKPAPIKRSTGKMGLGKMWELIPVMLDALTPFPAARGAGRCAGQVRFARTTGGAESGPGSAKHTGICATDAGARRQQSASTRAGGAGGGGAR